MAQQTKTTNTPQSKGVSLSNSSATTVSRPTTAISGRDNIKVLPGTNKFSLVGRAKPRKPVPPSHSRKKEKTWGEYLKGHASKGASWLWDYAWRHMFGATTRAMASTAARLKESAKVDWQYFTKSGAKDEESDTTKLLKTELSLLSQSVRTSVGARPMRVTIRIPFTLTATVTTGVVNSTVSIIPGSSGEFSSLAGIFNEYKCLSGEVQFAHFIRASYAIGVTAATLNTSALALCYDADSTALTSVVNATEYAQHALFPLGQQGGSITTTCDRHLFTYGFRVTPGVGVDTVSGSVESGAWAPTSSTTTTFGFIKSYCVATEVVALAVAQGVVHLHCEFRIRE